MKLNKRQRGDIRKAVCSAMGEYESFLLTEKKLIHMMIEDALLIASRAEDVGVKDAIEEHLRTYEVTQ